MAKWLEDSASLSSPVSGDLATTANLAHVVSGVPTSGENTKASGASGPSGSTPGGASSVHQPDARPAPPMYVAEHVARAARTRRLRAVGDVDDEGAAEVAAGDGPPP